ncbi:ABC transporter permease [Paenibacillus wynnii]|uniref:ABC transporter permease n=1 Tax=Paenibacillus wynnii TaxID=268407 RepID=UPI0027903DC5|nr:ABC transporter permease [Paenibacillus wynnii]MDQ0191881.1 ABC-type transport system involved in multi-copper enzyme maturation permease subunit [Paenibacillus wynnii]
MLKLISLEIRKNKLSGMLKGSLYANLGLLVFMVLVVFIDQGESDPTFASYAELFEGLFVFVKAVFIIFASVLLCKLVIDEYKNNTVTLLFMYPIPRKKLMAAKLIIVFLFTLAAIVISDVVLGAILIGINHFVNIIPGELTASLVTNELYVIVMGALYAAGIGLIPLYVGMRKKSVPATIVTAVLVVSTITSGFDQFRLGNLAAVSIFLALLGVGIAYLSIRKVETEDIA